VKYVLHPEADEELAEAVQYYADIDAGLGVRFYREIERLIFEVCAYPQRFRRFDPPARRHFSHSFPYAVIYLDEVDRVWIVAVMHMKRKPDYWRSRLK
jgi:plasmid stabilization system protein ParE